MSLVLLVLSLCLLSPIGEARRAIIDNNGYSDVVIAISPEIPLPNNTDIFFSQLEKSWKKASASLYQATRNRSYFESVNVLIPSSWTHDKTMESTWQTYADADFRIAPVSSAHPDGLPYTKQTGLCFERGDYVHVTPEFVANTDYSAQGKALVAEWAHLRYGVFQEYGEDDYVHPHFYRNSQNEIGPTVCTNTKPVFSLKTTAGGSCSIDSDTQLYDSTCMYELDPAFNPTSSLLSGNLEKDSVVQFCDSDSYLHNIEVPSRHNALCNSQSAWDVITASEDFTGGNNPPRNVPDQPKFSYFQYHDSDRYVLLFDISSSMSNSIAEINSMVKAWINRDILDNDLLAIVTFANTTKLNTKLVKISNETRKIFLDYVPTTASLNNGSYLMDGLNTSLQLLGSNGGTILLITDGCLEDCTVPDTMIDTLRTSHVRVVTAALTQKNNSSGIAVHLSKIVDATYGTGFADDARNPAKTLVVKKALTRALTYAPFPRNGMNSSTTILAQTAFSGVKQFDYSVAIDTTVGSNVLFRLDYTDLLDLKCITIGSSVKWCTSNGLRQRIPRADLELIIDDYTFTALFSAFTGTTCNVTVTTLGNSRAKYILTVTSEGRNYQKPIDMKCRLLPGYHFAQDSQQNLRIQAELAQGVNPVVGAKVFAKIGGINIEPLDDIELLDNGGGADLKANDGIYSRYVVNLKRISQTDSVFVSVDCYAWSDNGTSFVGGNNGFVSLSNFLRVNSAGAAEVYYNEDLNPSRITDMRLVSRKGNTVVLEWTVPGKFLDQDELDGAFDYSLGYSETPVSLIGSSFFTSNNVTRVSLLSNTSVPAGQILQVKEDLLLLLSGHTYFMAIALVSKSQSSTVSQPSNIVSVAVVADNGLSGGAVAGIVIGTLCLLMVAVLLGYLIIINRQSIRTQFVNLVGG